jgi:hypothetical protein
MKAFTAAVLGGIGNIPGAMLGGMLLGLLEAFAASLFVAVDQLVRSAPNTKDVVAFLVLILILNLSPKRTIGRGCAGEQGVKGPVATAGDLGRESLRVFFLALHFPNPRCFSPLRRFFAGDLLRAY